jgi:CRP-like cAMP-binding protein
MEDELSDLFSNFPSLNEEEIKAISKSIIVRAVKKGTILLKEGDISKECYSVLKGCVRKYYIKDGEEKTTAFFTEGEAAASFSSYINQSP